MRDSSRIIKTANLQVIDYAIILSHLGISLGIMLCFNQQLISQAALKSFTHIYFIVVPLAIFGLFFARLRNIYVNLIWISFGVAQFLLYPGLSEMHEFHYLNGNAFSGMSALLPTLIVFQLLRVIFMLTHNKELIVSIRHYRMSTWEEEENRHMTWVEIGFSLILFATIIISFQYW